MKGTLKPPDSGRKALPRCGERKESCFSRWSNGWQHSHLPSSRLPVCRRCMMAQRSDVGYTDDTRRRRRRADIDGDYADCTPNSRPLRRRRIGEHAHSPTAPEGDAHQSGAPSQAAAAASEAGDAAPPPEADARPEERETADDADDVEFEAVMQYLHVAMLRGLQAGGLAGGGTLDRGAFSAEDGESAEDRAVGDGERAAPTRRLRPVAWIMVQFTPQSEVAAAPRSADDIARALLPAQRDRLGHDDQCPICHDGMLSRPDGDTCQLAVCGHAYCRECVGMWLREHSTCPVCKRDAFMHLSAPRL